MAKKLTITTIVKNGNECVIYHDDGIYCSWTETQKFNFDLISKTKAEADGLVLLVSEAEAQANGGNGAKFDDHKSWCIPRWLIWMVYGKMQPADDKEAKTVEFMRSCII